MDTAHTIYALVLATAALAGAFFVLRKLYGWLFPIRIAPGIHIEFVEPHKDSIYATVTNRSREPLYLVKCQGRSANTLRYILRRHLRHPFTRPRLYPCIWFGAPTYAMMGSEPIRLEPGQPVTLSHKLNFYLPIFMFTNPMFQVELQLSNERTFRSRRVRIPPRWHISSYIASQKQAQSQHEPNTALKRTSLPLGRLALR